MCKGIQRAFPKRMVRVNSRQLKRVRHTLLSMTGLTEPRAVSVRRTSSLPSQNVSTQTISRNAITTVLQVTGTGVALFFFYGFLTRTLGTGAVGVWALIVAFTSVGRLGDIGLSSSVIRYVSEDLSRGQGERAADVIETTVLTLSGVMAILLVTGYPLIKYALMRIGGPTLTADMQGALPYAMCAFWFMTISMAINGALDGCQRIDLRNLVVVVGAVTLCISAIALVPLYGFRGIAYAQLVQAISVASLGWFLLRRQIPNTSFLPMRWRRATLVRIVKFGAGVQLIQLCGIVTDLGTKILLTHFGGVSTTGLYEMASKLNSQIRIFVLLPTQVVVPAITRMHVQTPASIGAFYVKLWRVLAYISIPYYGFAIAMTPGVAELWLGKGNDLLTIFLCVLLVASAVNTLCSAAYFAYMGIGKLRWIVASNIFIAFLSPVIGLIGGTLWSGIGIVVCTGSVFAIGSLIILFGFQVEQGLRFTEMVDKEALWLLGTVMVSVPTAIWMFWRINAEYGVLFAMLTSGVLFGGAIAIPLWRHPLRQQVLRLLGNVRKFSL